MPPKRKAPATKDIEPEETKAEKQDDEHKLKKVKETKKDAKPAKTDEPATELVRRSSRSKSNANEEKPKEKDTKNTKEKPSKDEKKPAPAKEGKAKKSEKEEDDDAMDEEEEQEKEDKKGKASPAKAKASPAKGKASPAKAKASPGKPVKDEKAAKDTKADKDVKGGKDAKKAKASPKTKGKSEKEDDDDKDEEKEKITEKKGKEDEDDDEKGDEEEDEKKKPKGKAEKAKKEESKATKKEDKKKGKEEKGKAAEKAKSKKKDDDDDDEEDEDEEEEEEKGATKAVVATNKGTKTLNRDRSLNEHLIDSYAGNTRPVPLGDGKIEGNEALITSWNINGINALLGKKHLENYMSEQKPDIICLNETKLTDENCEAKGMKWIPDGYTGYFNCCITKKGYAGTAIVSKVLPISVKFGIGHKTHDQEGRTITAEYENFYLVSCYVPNAGDKLQGLDYRVSKWDVDFKNYLDELKKKKHVILCGDLNVAHGDIDIYESKGKNKMAGFTPQERKSFTDFLDSGYVDTFRHFYPDLKKYSYFSIKHSMRDTNRGWRLDYFVIDKEGLRGVKDSLINEKIFGSDHLPIELKLDPQFTQS